LTGLYSRTANEDAPEYDVIIKKANVLDGSLKQPYRADVAVKGDKIVKVSRSINENAAIVIDANGLYLSPGFIDLHTHVDGGMYFPENRSCLNYLKQGVTSVIVGQCAAVPGLFLKMPRTR